MSQDWMNDPSLSKINTAKLEMLQSLAMQGSTKSSNDLLPFLMAASRNSRSNGMQFSPEEMDAVIAVMKKGKSPQETAKIERMLNLLKMMR